MHDDGEYNKNCVVEGDILESDGEIIEVTEEVIEVNSDDEESLLKWERKMPSQFKDYKVSVYSAFLEVVPKTYDEAVEGKNADK